MRLAVGILLLNLNKHASSLDRIRVEFVHGMGVMTSRRRNFDIVLAIK